MKMSSLIMVLVIGIIIGLAISFIIELRTHGYIVVDASHETIIAMEINIPANEIANRRAIVLRVKQEVENNN